MTKWKFALHATLAAAAIALAVGATDVLAQAPAKPHTGAPANTSAPAPRIIVVDRQAILRGSSVGQDIVRQVNGYTQSAEREFRAEQDGLQKESETLQQQVAILAPDVRAQKIKAFQAKEAAFKQKVEARQSLIQGGVLKARQQVEAALGPILQGIMQERGANILLDRAAVVLGMVNIDVTQLTIQRLNQKLPTVKVQLVSAPAGAVAMH
ncbi:MAG TPA: OmpH family outer membrane protein [Rhizomicrobium sp.]|jgi:Skp family chaperone for outer membrane proteins|nr:OmpH family outer membrane protein [Rhizomicrobium sp.]